MVNMYFRWKIRLVSSLNNWPQVSRANDLIMKVPYTKSVKCGNVVWQCVRYGQICYAAFIPFNPRTPAQVAVRGNFAEVSKRWRTLTDRKSTRLNSSHLGISYA